VFSYDTQYSVRYIPSQVPAKICKNDVKLKPEWKLLQTNALALAPLLP
jgi:hypothetical protein